MQYHIVSGDTLARVAAAHGLTLSQLLDLNPAFQANPDRIRVGDILALPDREKADPIAPGSAAAAAAAAGASRTAAGWVLGQLSERFETSGRGPGTVSHGRGDAGGASYGNYQMTSQPRGGTVARFVADSGFSFRERFAGLTPGSAAFTAAWKALATEHPDTFAREQHAFIKRTHYDPMVKALRTATGLDVDARSPGLRDCCWSTAVQHGPGNKIALGVLERLHQAGTPTPDMGLEYDEAVIREIYAERGRRRPDGKLAHFSRNSIQVQAGVANRFDRELRDALAMLENEKAFA